MAVDSLDLSDRSPTPLKANIGWCKRNLSWRNLGLALAVASGTAGMGLVGWASKAAPAAAVSQPAPTNNLREARGLLYVESAPGPATSPATTAKPVAEREKLAQSLIDSAGVGAAKGPEASQLIRSFSLIDTGVLQLLKNDGVRVAVVHPGINFSQLGVSQPRSVESYTAQIPQMRAQAEQAAAAARPFDLRLKSLQHLRAPLGPSPPYTPGGATNLTPQQHQAQILDQQIGELQRDKRRAIYEALPANPAVMAYTIPSLAGNVGDPAGLRALVARQAMPKGTAIMATLVGAKSPQEIQEYNVLVEAINGQRLQQARAESLQQAELNGTSKAQLDQWKKDPTLIPFDAKAHTILVPDLFYLADGQGGSQRITLQTANAASGWADQAGKTLPAYDLKKDSGSRVSGQYFPESRRVLIQSTKLSHGSGVGHAHTPTHELGHAIEAAVERHDPRFYAGWSGRLDAAFTRAADRNGPGTVSGYASTNPAEYIAEGVGHYYEDPKLLKAKDPTLYSLTQELLQRAEALAR